MKKLLFICSLFIFINSFAQQYTLPAELVKEFINNPTSKTSFDMIIETKLGDDNFYETIIKYSDKEKSFKLRPLTYPNFEIKLKQAIKDIIESTKIDDSNFYTTKEPNKSTIDKTIPFVFAEIITYHNSEEEKPIVANIYLKNTAIPVYFSHTENKEDKTTILKKLKQITVEISFYGGFIEKIQVQGVIGENKTPLTFNNIYSIGISSTANIQELNSYKLFSDKKNSMLLLSMI
jgi:hypothetical protein